MVYLFVAAVVFTLRWLFYPGLATLQFQAGDSVNTLEIYFQFRASFAILISSVYIYSYVKNWHFERVSVVILGLNVITLFMDYFNTYEYLAEVPKQWIFAMIVLRFLTVFCLLMNAMNARHAPKMPRRLWS